MSPIDLVIREDDLSHPEVRALLEVHAREMAALSPEDSCHVLDLPALREPGTTVWSAWDGVALAGVAGLRELDPHHGEVKSMRVVPDRVGRGVGAALLDHLIGVARARGYRRLSLETGSTETFEAALRLYASRGFVEAGPFAGYAEDGFSTYRALDLELAQSSASDPSAG